MVLAIFPKLIDVLKKSGNPEAGSFITALEDYRASLDKAFMKDLGDRKFAARAYLNSKLKFGVDNVCIEPQGYLLQIPGLSKERKKEMYEYVKSKLLTPEKIGIRTREKPLWSGKPEGEDGGIWFSLEYPLLLGVATFDKEEARSLLMKFSFQTFLPNIPIIGWVNGLLLTRLIQLCTAKAYILFGFRLKTGKELSRAIARTHTHGRYFVISS